jgi:hypothetical protein
LCACSSFDSGTIRSAARKAKIPTGTLTKKIQRHENACVSAPPSTRPTAEPPIAIAAQTPSALERSFPSANVVEMIESAAGEMSAAPKPCSARKPISIPEVVAMPFRNDGGGEDHESNEEEPLPSQEVARTARRARGSRRRRACTR